MDRTTTIIVLAFASLVLGAIATAIFIYVIVPWRRRRRAAKEKAANPTPTQTNSPPEQPEPYTSAKRSSNVKQHSLFIIFDQPPLQSFYFASLFIGYQYIFNQSVIEIAVQWCRTVGLCALY